MSRRLPGLWIGAALLGVLLTTASLAPWLVAPARLAIDVPNKLALPSAAHWLGTDSLGRDVLALLLAGAPNSWAVAGLAVGLGLAGGVALGALAAARGGWVDAGVARVADFGQAFPALLSALVLAATVGPGRFSAALAIALFNLPWFARVTRNAARSVWATDYVQAARLAGRSRWAITWDHVLPNIAGTLAVQASGQLAIALLAEAALSFLGLGTQAPLPSWGRMLADAHAQLFEAPWLAVWPGLAIAASVLGLNLLGDGLRDHLDPRASARR